jgi:hypothetical protein
VKAETEFDQYNNLPTTPIVNGNKITETGKKKISSSTGTTFHHFLLGNSEKPEAFTLSHTS